MQTKDDHKDMLITEILRLLKDSNDVELIQLIYILLLKDQK